MLRYNEVANNINIIILNYEYSLNKLMSINYLIVNWIQLTKNFSSFCGIKHKWFKFFMKTVLSRTMFNKKYGDWLAYSGFYFMDYFMRFDNFCGNKFPARTV